MKEEIIYTIVITIILGPLTIWAIVNSSKKWKKKNKDQKKRANL